MWGSPVITPELIDYAGSQQAHLVIGLHNLKSTDEPTIVVCGFALLLTTGLPLLGYSQVGGRWIKMGLPKRLPKTEPITITSVALEWKLPTTRELLVFYQTGVLHKDAKPSFIKAHARVDLTDRVFITPEGT